MEETIKRAITAGETVLGIELGSTRIKAVLIDRNGNPVASGGHSWENRLENGLWTYSLRTSGPDSRTPTPTWRRM